MTSWKPVVRTVGDGDTWSSNALRFATKQEAYASAYELSMRWLAVVDIDAHESDDPINYKFDDGRNVSI